MSQLLSVKEAITGCFRRGEHEMEAGYPYENPLNDLQRELIAAFKQEHGDAWLGKCNLYRNVDAHLPVLWRWDGGLVYNFGCSFVVPKFDEELYELIILRHYAPYTGTSADYQRIVKISDRVAAIGGEYLFWN